MKNLKIYIKKNKNIMQSYMTFRKNQAVAPTAPVIPGKLNVSENSAFSPYVKKEETLTKEKITNRKEAFSYIRNLFSR